MLGELQSGVCRVCGCTDNSPCAIEPPLEMEFDPTQRIGCWWIDARRTLCSNPNCLAVVPLEQIERELQEEANAASVAG